MSDKMLFDLKKFRETKSVAGMLYAAPGQPTTPFYPDDVESVPRGCAQGKVGIALGLIKEGMNSLDGSCAFARWRDTHRPNLFNIDPARLTTIINTNNAGNFEEADAMILQWAVESGNFEFINGLPEQMETIESLELAKVK